MAREATRVTGISSSILNWMESAVFSQGLCADDLVVIFTTGGKEVEWKINKGSCLLSLASFLSPEKPEWSQNRLGPPPLELPLDYYD